MALSSVIRRAVLICSARNFHLTPISSLKEIVATEEGKTTVIEAKYVPSPREPFTLKIEGEACKGCAVCKLVSLGIDVKHTDVLVLHQFVRSDGCMLPRRITGLCGKQQRRIASMVAMAQKAGILTPPGVKSDPSKRMTYKKFNTYFDESTIWPWENFSKKPPAKI